MQAFGTFYEVLYGALTIQGLTGFDSKMDGYVSMWSLAMTLVKLDRKTIIGENNYALAA